MPKSTVRYYVRHTHGVWEIRSVVNSGFGSKPCDNWVAEDTDEEAARTLCALLRSIDMTE